MVIAQGSLSVNRHFADVCVFLACSKRKWPCHATEGDWWAEPSERVAYSVKSPHCSSSRIRCVATVHIVLQTARMNRPWAEGQYRTVEWSKFVIVWNQAFLGIFSHQGVPSVLWQGIWPVKNEWWAAGMVICLNQDADLYMAQLMPLHSLSLASVKSRLVLPFWYQLTWVLQKRGR